MDIEIAGGHVDCIMLSRLTNQSASTLQTAPTRDDRSTVVARQAPNVFEPDQPPQKRYLQSLDQCTSKNADNPLNMCQETTVSSRKRTADRALATNSTERIKMTLENLAGNSDGNGDLADFDIIYL